MYPGRASSIMCVSFAVAGCFFSVGTHTSVGDGISAGVVERNVVVLYRDSINKQLRCVYACVQ